MAAKKGYYFDTTKGVWHVRVYDKVNGKYHHVGYYKTENEAAIARSQFDGDSAPVPQSKESADSLRRILASSRYRQPINRAKEAIYGQ